MANQHLSHISHSYAQNLKKHPRFLPIISNTFIKNSDILQQMSEFIFLPSEKILQCSFGSETVRKKETNSLLSRARVTAVFIFLLSQPSQNPP